jgi:hypothetical protein
LTEALGHFTSAGNLVRQAECLEIMGDLSAQRAEEGDTNPRISRQRFASFVLAAALRVTRHRVYRKADCG